MFDVADPADPEQILVHETEFFHHNLDTDGETLYLCGNDGDRNPLVCVDVETGREAGRWSVLDADDRWAEAHPASGGFTTCGSPTASCTAPTGRRGPGSSTSPTPPTRRH
ncbi:hypothetical protein BRC99_05495 [Halobacteriales archaeon QS_7_69_60]|nr:MAG: hypothetical protein BRC99_05495 [Halobacteriales archaeon QS_7_69_60]